MSDTGHITLWNVECIFVEESDDISIVQSVKDALIIHVDEYLREGLEQEETDFLNNAKDPYHN
ncbi:hypothetical protein [Lacrimispora xylanolytica]|uniref:RNase H-like HicB family nuclease n=1 Tax=Lacrimispora xylanolytica TaxID=29375 RepID=A0ABY7A6C6_9FIRM|nr:hypothetical protein [Lacrimispora xylanolytica]WAJ22081.1 hypothetical protein OW255_10850 [Lacrimispora xylanolytica]